MVELTTQAAQADWKAKYLDSLDAHERVEREAAVRVNELGSLIARLSRTLVGKESAELRKRLGVLADALRRKPLDGRLSRDVKDVHTRVLDVMDLHERERAEVMAALQQAASRLEQYCLNRTLKRGLREFRASLGCQEPPSIGELLGGLGELHTQALDLTSAASTMSLSDSPQAQASPLSADEKGANSTGSSSTDEDQVGARGPISSRESGASKDKTAEQTFVDWAVVREVLSELLRRLSLPIEFKEQMAELNSRITHGLDERSLLQILEQLRDLFDVSLETLDREFRGFLDSVDQRLDTLLCNLGEAHEQERAALTREQGFADSFQASLDTLRDDTKSATDLAVLKSSIDTHLDTLVRSMHDRAEELRGAGGERDARLMAMTARLQELESESKQARTQLETQRRLALTDSLTGLANRKAFDERMREEILLATRHSTTLAIAIADIDHFKQVNDTYGHVAGDRALALFARILCARVRATDFCARYGGEEFVMLFPATTVENAMLVVEQVRGFVESCGFSYKGKPVPLTASFGVAECLPQDDIASILERADKAMYAAKASGRNRVCMGS